MRSIVPIPTATTFLEPVSLKTIARWKDTSAAEKMRCASTRVCRGPAAYEANALRDVRDGVVPVGFVLDRDVAVEFLPPQFREDRPHVGDSGAEDLVEVVRPQRGSLLQVQA